MCDEDRADFFRNEEVKERDSEHMDDEDFDGEEDDLDDILAEMEGEASDSQESSEEEEEEITEKKSAVTINVGSFGVGPVSKEKLDSSSSESEKRKKELSSDSFENLSQCLDDLEDESKSDPK